MSKIEGSPQGLWFNGANFAADNVITRAKSDSQTEFEVLLIQRRDNGKWALPGGFVDKGETAEVAALRELKEEAGADLSELPYHVTYTGLVNDPRNTQDSWIETTVFHRELPVGHNIEFRAGDDAADCRWTPINEENLKDLHADHAKFIRMALESLKIRNDLKYSELDVQDTAAVKAVAHLHQLAPTTWDPSYVVTQASVDSMKDLFLELAPKDSTLFLIAKTGEGNIVGFHWVQIEEKQGQPGGHICSLWVNEEMRSFGIGSELKLRGEVWAKAKGAKFVYTDVFFSNQKMINYNLKRGFKARQVEMFKDL